MAGIARRAGCWWTAWLALCVATPAHAGKPAAAEPCVPVISYHQREPFVADAARRDGLSFVLIDALNRARPGGRCYVLQFAPLVEIRERVEAGEAFVLPWASNTWSARHFALPSTTPLFFDSNVVVSRRAAPLEYAGLESLRGRSLGVVRGFASVGLDGLVEQGQARVRMAELADTFAALRAGELDAVVLPSSALRALGTRVPMAELHVATAAQDAYGRALLYTPALAAAGPALERFAEDFRSDPAWRSELARRELDRLFSPADLDLEELTEVPLPADGPR